MDTDLTNASLKNADLEGATLEGVILKHATLNGAVLGGANLAKTDLSFAKMAGADLSGANMEKTTLNETNLRGTTLREATFNGTNFRSADLTGADLRATTLRLADLTDTKLGLADLRGAKLLSTPLTPLEESSLGLSLEERKTWEERPCRIREGNPEDEACRKQWEARIPPEQPCFMTTAWGPCRESKDLETYDRQLATFLAGLACEDGANARAVIRRLDRLKDDPHTAKRPLADLLGNRLVKQDCPEITCLPAEVLESVAEYRGDAEVPERTCPD
uniref:Pentapeptide repeat-containing protein n=1 Tax=Candidatus Kentrum eta TaxID=2126337 RepID=A0A450V4H5_9GAMM|nr:MAG: Pentapeptide repeat-containing protein [Candidatus Kentron sp. H]VFJ99721.1 MAG: Pentapeptide repeat-containing protein [Candidatus Kentron sp. H]VFK04095.1 MAG: Pentapeptide repeat-containing protein [Candidatus Kentron sp. H]